MNDKIDDVQKKVIHAIAEVLQTKTEKITPPSSLADDLEMDSLSAIEVVFQLEEVYDIQIMDDEIRKFEKVQDIIDYIKLRLTAQ